MSLVRVLPWIEQTDRVLIDQTCARPLFSPVKEYPTPNVITYTFTHLLIWQTTLSDHDLLCVLIAFPINSLVLDTLACWHANPSNKFICKITALNLQGLLTHDYVGRLRGMFFKLITHKLLQ